MRPSTPLESAKRQSSGDASTKKGIEPNCVNGSRETGRPMIASTGQFDTPGLDTELRSPVTPGQISEILSELGSWPNLNASIFSMASRTASSMISKPEW